PNEKKTATLAWCRGAGQCRGEAGISRTFLETRAKGEDDEDHGNVKKKHPPPVNVRRHKLYEYDGLHRNSGLPELRNIMRRKSGKPDLQCQRPAMTAEEEMLLYSRALTRRQVFKASAETLPPVITAARAAARTPHPPRP